MLSQRSLLITIQIYWHLWQCSLKMLLAHATWPEVEAYLGRSDGIIIPLGSIEQHGPIGLIGNDMLCARSIATEVGNSTGALVAPTISYSPAVFNMAFPGTISLKVTTFSQVLDEIINSLDHHGFRHFYFLNGHGANIAPLAVLVKITLSSPYG